tara:strand:- start:2452 stop:3342 length:891 start_codon:yes stop_codon:yes gene_type:complete
MLPVYNGEDYLKSALNSLISQTYRNIEIIILDNHSSDKTREICESFLKKDSRIKYILDTRRRTANDAQSYLATLISGEYCMLAGDDDKWDKNYIKLLVQYLQKNLYVSMVYSKMSWFDINDKILESNVPNTILLAKNTIFKNLLIYLSIRSCVPMVFGLFRSKNYITNSPWKNFDYTLTDVDNLFIINFLSNNKVHCIDENLFFYRFKDRSIQKKGSTNSKWQLEEKKVILPKILEKFYHEVNFFIEIIKILIKTNIGFIKKLFLALVSFIFCIERSFFNISKLFGQILRKIKIIN